MLVPEEFGGGSVSGAGLSDAAVVATERGRILQPGPFVPTNVVADALARAGSEDQRPSGTTALCWPDSDSTPHAGASEAAQHYTVAVVKAARSA